MPIQSVIGALHDQSVIDRYRQLGLSDYFIKMLEEGVDLELTSESDMIKSCRRVANSSSLEQPEAVVEIIEDWMQRGFIEEIHKKDVKVCHPLTLSERFIHEQQGYKNRLCLDLSTFNRFITTPSTKFPTIDYIGNKLVKMKHIGLIDMKGKDVT